MRNVVLASYDYLLGPDGRRHGAVESFRRDDGSYERTGIQWLYDGAARLVEERFDFDFAGDIQDGELTGFDAPPGLQP